MRPLDVMRPVCLVLVIVLAIGSIMESASGQQPPNSSSLALVEALDGSDKSGAVEDGSGRSEWHPVFARPVSLRLTDIRLDEALKAIAAAGGVQIAFSDDALPVSQLVSLNAAELPLGEAIRTVLSDAEVDLWVSDGGHIVIIPTTNRRRSSVAVPAFGGELKPRMIRLVGRDLSAQGTIRGRVTDAATGQPVSGAQVMVVDTRDGTLSGSDGSYTIGRVPAGVHRVQVTHVAYAAQTGTATVTSGQITTLDFMLEQEAITLEGVVAVGYGTQRRRDVTGSVASVSQDRLEDLPNTNVAQAIQGAVPGVSITTTGTGAEPRYEILIRGQNSITASNDPLLVIDGVPNNRNLSEINQSDIASIDILKDASSTAIYGARGANGVILITTKKGRVGAPRISYEGYLGVQQATKAPRVMTGEEFGAWKCEFFAPMPCEEALTATERNMLQSGQYTDWYSLASRRGQQQQHNLSLSGGSDDTRFYLSGSAMDTEGIALNDQFQRYTVRVNLDQNVGSRIDAGVSTQLSYADRSGQPVGLGGAFKANPLIPAFDENGVPLEVPWPEDPQRTNLLENLNVVDDDLTRRTLASGYLEVRLPFLEGLSYRLNGGIDFLSQDVGRYWGRNTNRGRNQQGSAETRTRRSFDWTVENIARYRREIGLHSFDVTALYGAQALSNEASTLNSRGFPNDILTYRQADIAATVQPSSAISESGLVSQMGRLNYGYDGRYLLTLTARRDGYSGFGKNYKYGLFPSVALAWNASEEPFWGSETFNTLKVRLSYGENGNQAIPPYRTLARLQEFSSYDEGSWPGFKVAALANPNLRWETTTSLNGGLDFGFYGDRLRGTLDIYSSDTHDLLLERQISAVHGIGRILQNIGSVRNRGVEFALAGIPMETSRFTWMADFNIAANRNEVLDLYGDRSDDLGNQWFIGQSINTHYGWEFDGVWQQGDDIENSAQPGAQPGDARVRDVNGDGKIDVNDRTFLGTEDPSYTAGLSNTFRFGNVSLNAFIYTVQGVTLYSYDLLGWNELARDNALYFEWWTPENPIDTRWANRQSANPYEVGLRDDASFVRLRDLSLSYDLPTSLTERFGAENLRLYVNGRNLWTLTDWKLLDPEIVPGAGAPRPPPPGAPVAQTNAAPHQRTTPMERVFSIGINASF